MKTNRLLDASIENDYNPIAMRDNNGRPANAGSAASTAAPGPNDNVLARELAAQALDDVMPTVYEELRQLAAGYLRGERPEQTLQPTALVHEAYLRLLEQGRIRWQDRAHVLGFGARIMRQILINRAVARNRLKRGGADLIRITLDEALDFYDRREMSLTAVDQALRALEELDARQAQIVEMRFFGGLTIEEISRALEISSATVKRQWTVAKIWLRRELSN